MLRYLLSSLLLCSVLFTSALAQQAEKQPMTVDDVLGMVGVSNPVISPDAKWIVFSRSDLDWDHNKRPTHLWLVPAGGGQSFQFTSTEGDSAPEWSPDSKSIAFLRGKPENEAASAGEEPQGRQIWLIPVNGGEAKQLTTHKDGIVAFRWAENGEKIFFLARQARSDAEKKKMKEGDNAIYVDEGPNGQSQGEWSHLWSFDLAAKKETEIVKDNLMIGTFDPSPDGKQIAFTARKENSRNGEYLSEIYIADVASGKITRLTNNQAPESRVKWAPDGKRISYLAPDDKEWKLRNQKIWVMDAATKEYKEVSGEFEGSIGYYSWTEDGRSILFSGQQKTARNIYRLNLDAGSVGKVTKEPGVMLADSFSRDGKEAAAIYSTAQLPPDVWAIDTADGAGKQLTDFNPWVKSKKLAESEVINWKSSDGLPIAGILYLPEDYKRGPRIPLILTVHGGPAGSFTNGFSGIYHVYTGLGYAVLCPNVRGSSGYSDSFLDGNHDDLGGGDYHDLMTGVDAVIARGIADPNQLGIRGWSYGGILSGWTITQTNRFKAASLGAMVTDWAAEYAMGFNFDISRWYIGGTPWDNPHGYRKESSYSYIKNVKTPSILFHGERDTTDTIGQSMIYYQALKDRGVPVRFIRFPGEPHGFRQPHHQRIRDVEEIAWMQKYVRGIDWKSERPAEKSSSRSEPGSGEKPEPRH